MLLVLSALEGMNNILSVQREKGSKTKSSVPFSKVVKLYNSDMGEVYLMDQRTGSGYISSGSKIIC